MSGIVFYTNYSKECVHIHLAAGEYEFPFLNLVPALLHQRYLRVTQETYIPYLLLARISRS